MNTLSLDDAYGNGSMDDIQAEEAPQARGPQQYPQAPQQQAPQQQAPRQAPRQAPQQAPRQAPQQAPQYQPQLHPQLQTDPRRRQVRFNDETRKRFARVDGASVDSSSWMERNKTMVAGVTVALILILIAVLVMVCKRKPVLAVGGVPEFVGGGPGWDDSVSQFAYY